MVLKDVLLKARDTVQNIDILLHHPDGYLLRWSNFSLFYRHFISASGVKDRVTTSWDYQEHTTKADLLDLTLRKQEIELMLNTLEMDAAYSLIGSRPITRCDHDWKETIGVFSVWKDCSKCGVKYEDQSDE